MSSGWPAYLARARWFAAKDSGRLTGIEPLDWYTRPGALPAVRSELARVARGRGEETYHLLVGYLASGTAEPDALVDRIELDGLGEVDVVDAPASLTAMEALFDALDASSLRSARVEQPSEPFDKLRERPPGTAERPHDPERPLGPERSLSSVHPEPVEGSKGRSAADPSTSPGNVGRGWR